MPPLLAARNLPQALLLTALFLLIGVATTMLACGPAAQPAPAADGALPAAQQSDGGDEPTEEPTVKPTEEPTETPTVKPTEEPMETPTVKPTDTPTPNSTECVTIPPEYQATPELAAGQVWMDGIKYQCFVIMPTPTPKYPELGGLSRYAAEADEAQSEADVKKVDIAITLSSKSDTEAVISWLRDKGVPIAPLWSVGYESHIYSYGDNDIAAYIPASLLIPLSKQPGVTRIKPAGPHPSPN